MNAISPQMIEELIGIKMAEMAYMEGHRPGVPKMDRTSIEKARKTYIANNRSQALGNRYRQTVLKAIKIGLDTSRKIANATDIPEDSVRKSLRHLEADRMIRRAGHVQVPGGRCQVWRSVTP